MNMVRKNALLLLGGAALLALLAVVLLQPVTITEDGTEIRRLQVPFGTVGQALHQAGVEVDPADQIQPALDQPAPRGGTISITRAPFAYLWENGQLQPLHGQDRTPGGLLRSAGITLTPGDRVLRDGLPVELSEPLAAHHTTVLQVVRARTMKVTVNGQNQTIQTTGPTAAHALWQAGIAHGPGDLISLRPEAVIEEQSELAYQAARPLTIQVGEQLLHTRSAAETVGQALSEAGAALQGLDYSIPAENQLLPEDGQIRVVRVREEIVLQEELIPYGQNSQPDPELPLDQTRVLQAGQYGVKVVRERARFEDDQETHRAVDSDWTASEPRDQTVGYGTLAVPQTMDTPDGPIEYYRALRVYATSYSPCRLGIEGGGCNYQTSSGATLTKGIVAVTLPWYRMMAGQRVYIPGYGFAVIADVGGGIDGTPWIDLGFSEEDYQPMIGWMTMYLLTPVPANVPWALPY